MSNTPYLLDVSELPKQHDEHTCLFLLGDDRFGHLTYEDVPPGEEPTLKPCVDVYKSIVTGKLMMLMDSAEGLIPVEVQYVVDIRKEKLVSNTAYKLIESCGYTWEFGTISNLDVEEKYRFLNLDDNNNLLRTKTNIS